MSCATYLVEVSPQEVNLSRIFEQTRPVLFLQLLLSQHHLNVGGCVVCLGIIWIDLAEEFELDMICGLLRVRGAGEGELGGGKVELQ